MDMDMILECHGELIDDEICTYVHQENEPEDECESADEEVSTSAHKPGETLLVWPMLNVLLCKHDLIRSNKICGLDKVEYPIYWH